MPAFLDIPAPIARFRPNATGPRARLIPEDCHGQSRIAEDQARVERRHRLLLRHQEKLAHHDRQAGEEEIRPDRQEARRIPRVENQVSVLVIPDARSAIRDPDFRLHHARACPGHLLFPLSPCGRGWRAQRAG